jgi:hypothetical protein
MCEIQMNEFGVVLTGRAYGKDCFEKMSRSNLLPPFILNFNGVISLGSSFGEEIIVPLSKMTTDFIKIINANSSIQDCIQKIEIDFKLKLVINAN